LRGDAGGGTRTRACSAPRRAPGPGGGGRCARARPRAIRSSPPTTRGPAASAPAPGPRSPPRRRSGDRRTTGDGSRAPSRTTPASLPNGVSRRSCSEPYRRCCTLVVMRIGMLTGGGDCPGLNAVIRAVVRKGEVFYGDEIVGFRHGWRGVIDDERVDLGVESTRGLVHRGGTILGTSRTNPFQTDDGPARALDTLARER